MSYTPSMSPKEIADLDRKRSMGGDDDDPSDTYPISDNPKAKKPWLIRTPVNKGNSMEFLDSLKNFAKGFKEVEIEDEGDEIEVEVKKAKEHGEEGGTDWDLLTLTEKKEVMPKVNKALNTRSLHIPRVPYDMLRSATTPVTRRNSKLYSPNGVAPLVGETLEDVSDNERKKVPNTTFKSCETHGVVHKSTQECSACALYKGCMCKDCGELLTKTSGGGLSCVKCSGGY